MFLLTRTLLLVFQIAQSKYSRGIALNITRDCHNSKPYKDMLTASSLKQHIQRHLWLLMDVHLKASSLSFCTLTNGLSPETCYQTGSLLLV